MACNEKPHTHYHKDGSIWAKGNMSKDMPVGYWEWFRKDGSKLRSGHFDDRGQQTGQWTTYDKSGKVYKVTNIKPNTDKPKPTKIIRLLPIFFAASRLCSATP